MMSSRGMGCIERGPSKGKPTAFAKGGEVPKLILRKDAMEPVKVYAKGGEVWGKPRPEKLGAPKPLSAKRKASAKATAKAAGRPYPNLIDNMRAAKG